MIDHQKGTNTMNLYIVKYIEKMLRQANYEYDEQTRSWCASVDVLPGAYA